MPYSSHLMLPPFSITIAFGRKRDIKRFRQILPKQSIGIFICALLPRCVRVWKVELHSIHNAFVTELCLENSLPRSGVMVLSFFLGRAESKAIILSATKAEYRLLTFSASRYRLHLSVMVTRQAEPVFPATVSASQCPMTCRLSASLGRS